MDIKKAYIANFCYSLAVLIVRIKVGIIWGGDTQQYIDKSVIRPPVYPLVMDVFKFIFASHEFFALICFQLIFVLSASFYLSHLLWKKFNLQPISFILLHLFLSLPLLSLSVAAGIHGEIGNRLLTESISYGLFLIVISFLVKIIFFNKRRYFIIFLLLVAILTLIRTQMIFLYMIAVLLIPLLYIKAKNVRVTIGLFTIVLAVFLFMDLGEKFYHQTINGYFGKISLNASHMLVGAVYVSDSQSLNLIVNKKDREVLKRTYDYLESKKLLAKQRFEIKRRLVDIYNDHFNIILYDGLVAAFQHSYTLPNRNDEMLTQFEGFSRRVVPILFFNYYKDIAKLMLLKFLYTLNFREGFFISFFLLFPFSELSCELKKLSFFVLLMLIINRLIMTPIIYIGDRYLFYTDILEYVVLIIATEKYIKNYFLRNNLIRTSETNQIK